MATNTSKRHLEDANAQTAPSKRHITQPYTIKKVKESKIVKYGVEEFTFKATFKDDYQPRRLLDAQDDLHNIFRDIIDEATNHYDQNDRVMFILISNELAFMIELIY